MNIKFPSFNYISTLPAPVSRTRNDHASRLRMMTKPSFAARQRKRVRCFVCQAMMLLFDDNSAILSSKSRGQLGIELVPLN